MRLEGIQSGISFDKPELKTLSVSDKQTPTFKDTLASFVNDVNTAQNVAGDAQKKFLAGDIKDAHQVISKSEEANVAFNMLMELKNKSADGFQEIMRTRL